MASKFNRAFSKANKYDSDSLRFVLSDLDSHIVCELNELLCSLSTFNVKVSVSESVGVVASSLEHIVRKLGCPFIPEHQSHVWKFVVNWSLWEANSGQNAAGDIQDPLDRNFDILTLLERLVHF